MRGTGRTTYQMLDAKVGSVFIWCNGHLDYPKELARRLHRKDLRIERPSWLSSNRWRGMRFPGIVVDHAAVLSEEELHSLVAIRSTCCIYA